MSRRRVLHRVFLGLACLVASACGFVEAATELTIGSGQLQRVSYDFRWPSIDALIGDKLVTGASLPPELPGLPGSYEASTLAHLQGLMVLTGECRGEVKQAEVLATSGNLRQLTVTAVNCGSPDRCQDECKGFVGMRLETRYQVQLIDEATAQKVAGMLTGTSPAAIVQVRMRFYELAFKQLQGGKDTDITSLFRDFELGLAMPDSTDETAVVQGPWLMEITPETPRRFELDPEAHVTQEIRKAIVGGQPLWVEVYQRLSVAQPDLYSVRLTGGGVLFDFQPEVVLSVLDIAGGKL
jgi:hypothetical protein